MALSLGAKQIQNSRSAGLSVTLKLTMSEPRQRYDGRVYALVFCNRKSRAHVNSYSMDQADQGSRTIRKIVEGNPNPSVVLTHPNAITTEATTSADMPILRWTPDLMMKESNDEDEPGSTFSNIFLQRWRQFEDIDIDLHPRLTILTGANGTGKTTILSILESNLVGGNRDKYLATPVEGKPGYKTGFSISTLFSKFIQPSASHRNSLKEVNEVGQIRTSEESITRISHQPAKLIQYELEFSGKNTVKGFKIGSHRAVPKYQHVHDIPVSGMSPSSAFEYFRESTSNYEMGETLIRGRTRISNPISPLKQTLIAFALQGSSNADVTAVPEVEGLFRDFQDILRKVLPEEIRFKKLDVRPPEVIVVSETGDFPIDGASGGLMSLIQVSWQIFLFTKANKGRCAVLMDEPENHLHPSLQRKFLLLLVETFQNVQFVVVTHSPFIISSVRDCYVYALRYEDVLDSSSASSADGSAVKSIKVDFSKNAATASQILDEVLGVSVTMPIWAEERLIRIVDRLNKHTVDEVSMSELRRYLEAEGLSDFLPMAISRLLK